MEFKRCKRCGNFYNTELEVCQDCKPKENLDVEKLRNYIDQYGVGATIQDISYATGINTKNLNRYFESQEFSGLFGKGETGETEGTIDTGIIG